MRQTIFLFCLLLLCLAFGCAKRAPAPVVPQAQHNNSVPEEKKVAEVDGYGILQHEEEVVLVEPVRLTYYEDLLEAAVGPEKQADEISNRMLEDLFRLQRKRLQNKKFRALRNPRNVRVYSDRYLLARRRTLPNAPLMGMPLVAEIPASLPLRARNKTAWGQQLRFLVPKNSSVPYREWETIIAEAGRRHGLDPLFIAAIIKAESNFDPKSVSPVGAQGAMQIMPGTQVDLGLKDPFNVRANVLAGTAYIRSLLNKYTATELALAAYNAGPNAVQKAKGIPPYVETQQFVQRVLGYWLMEQVHPSRSVAAQNTKKEANAERKTKSRAKKDRGKRGRG